MKLNSEIREKLNPEQQKAFDFALKWEEQADEAKSQWNMACKYGGDAELIEGARMQGVIKMMDRFYEVFDIPDKWARRFNPRWNGEEA